MSDTNQHIIAILFLVVFFVLVLPLVAVIFIIETVFGRGYITGKT